MPNGEQLGNKKELLFHAKTWMNLENIKLSKKRQSYTMPIYGAIHMKSRKGKKKKKIYSDRNQITSYLGPEERRI